MIRYRNALEQIAALANIGSHAGHSISETLRHFVMIEHLANKALHNPGQPRLATRVKPRGKPKAVPRFRRLRSRTSPASEAHSSIER